MNLKNSLKSNSIRNKKINDAIIKFIPIVIKINFVGFFSIIFLVTIYDLICEFAVDLILYCTSYFIFLKIRNASLKDKYTEVNGFKSNLASINFCLASSNPLR